MRDFFIQVLTGLGTAGILFMVASGVSLIFGALRVINMAHGSFYMLGAYLMLTVWPLLGAGNIGFIPALLITAALVSLVGGVVEVLIFRRLYNRPMLIQLVVAFGLIFIASGVIRWLYGSSPFSTRPPELLRGAVRVLDAPLPQYQFFVMAMAVAVVIGLWLLLYRTGLGRTIRAAVSDPSLLQLSGVNVPWLFTKVFMVATFLAGLAGAIVTSQGAVYPGMDFDVLILAFVVVVIGGLGSLVGTFVASVLVGISQSLAVLWLPGGSLFVVFGILVLVLAVRPQGLFGQAEGRR